MTLNLSSVLSLEYTGARTRVYVCPGNEKKDGLSTQCDRNVCVCVCVCVQFPFKRGP